MEKPTGIQYLMFQGIEALGIVRGDIFDIDTGIWYVWILSPLISVARILPDGTVDTMESKI